MSYRARAGVRTVLQRFRGNDNGATAIEFAFIALPFFALLFAIVQVSLVLFANQALQTMVNDAGRKLILTGRAQQSGLSVSSFKREACGEESYGFFNCAKLHVQVQAFDDFASANPAAVNSACFDPEQDAPTDCFDPGEAKQIVIMRFAYEWPFGLTMADIDGKQMLIATSAFRNEPF